MRTHVLSVDAAPYFRCGDAGQHVEIWSSSWTDASCYETACLSWSCVDELTMHGTGLGRTVTNKGTQSPWTSVTSGVPQGSVLGPTLFTIYTNDLDENIKSQIPKFADDTKILAPVSNQEQIIELQEDLASAFHWAGKWQMAFNPGKCKCVHFGHANPKHEYTMGAQKIAHSTEEKDLGVVINQSLSPSHHIATCVSRANRLVGLIKRTY